jgi:Domain of unknown function (DUF6933)
MTRIYCTNKLQNFFGTVEQVLPSEQFSSEFGDWNGHLFWIEKRKCLIFMNNKTYYSIFFLDILKKDLEDFPILFNKQLVEQLTNDNIINYENEAFVNALCEKLTFYKTNNDRRILGMMNDFIYHFKANFYGKYEHLSEMDVIYETSIINNIPTGKPRELKKTWTNPIENLKELKSQFPSID